MSSNTRLRRASNRKPHQRREGLRRLFVEYGGRFFSVQSKNKRDRSPLLARFACSQHAKAKKLCSVSPQKKVLAWRYGSVHRNYAHNLAGVGRSNGESRAAIEAKPAGAVTV